MRTCVQLSSRCMPCQGVQQEEGRREGEPHSRGSKPLAKIVRPLGETENVSIYEDASPSLSKSNLTRFLVRNVCHCRVGSGENGEGSLRHDDRTRLRICLSKPLLTEQWHTKTVPARRIGWIEKNFR
jgi:hypothetical protein